jgi:pimeloyl-ACP methyl ester carboxylesterase
LAEQGFRAITVDNRDVGNSSSCEGISYSIDDMADDAVAVLDELGIDRGYVLGISMGGMIAQKVALNHPERVSKLMLMATGPGGGGHGVPPSPEVSVALMTPPPDGDRVTYGRKILELISGPGFGERHPDRIEMAMSRGSMIGGNEAGVMRQMQAVMGCDTWESLSSITTPTMILHGDADPLVPTANGENLASRIPGAELVLLPGVGHLIPLEVPEQAFQAIVRFFPVENKVEAG